MLMTNLISNNLFHSVGDLQVDLYNKNYLKEINVQKNFVEVNVYLCYYQTNAGFKSLNQAEIKQSYSPCRLPLGHGSS